MKSTSNYKLKRQVMSKVFRKTNGRCGYCGDILDPFSSWQIDHIAPRGQGGSDDLFNLIAACQGCNVRKGSRTPEQYKEACRARVAGPVEKSTASLMKFRPNITEGAYNEILEAVAALEAKANALEITWYFETLEGINALTERLEFIMRGGASQSTDSIQ